MLVFSKAIVNVDRVGNVKIEGALAPYRSRILHFLHDEHIVNTSIRLRDGYLLLSGNVTPNAGKKVAEFLSSECPVP